MPDTTDAPLADAIKSLRNELMRAAAEGADKDVRFRLGPIKLDLEVAASYTGGGEAGVHWYLISFGAKAEASRSRTHTIHLELQPVGPEGEDFLVGARANEEPS